MVGCGYIFDAIFANVQLAEMEEDLTGLNVRIAFNFNSVTLTSSNINVTEIPEGKGMEFEIDTQTVRTLFAENPIEALVRFTDMTLGVALVPWPQEVLEKMEKMQDAMFYVTITLENPEDPEETPGSLDMLVRLTPKCKNMGDEDFGEAYELIKDEILQNIGSKDLFFLLANEQHLEACGGEYEIHNEPPQVPMSLDVSKFKDFNGQLVPTPSILNQCCSPDCCGLKKQAKKYGAKDKSCGAMKMLTRGKKKDPTDSCLICGNMESSSEHESLVSDEEESIGDVIWGGNEPKKFCLDTPPPELLQTVNIHPRSCPVCQTNVDWLPAYTPCPKCGYKALPQIGELPYSHNIKAEEILKEFYFREPSSDPINCRAAVHHQEDTGDECDCECQTGNTCPHCRVRRACKHVFGAKFDLCDAKDTVAQPPMYSKPLQQVFCNLKNLLDNIDIMQNLEEKEKCSNILHDHEEQQVKQKIFGDARYKACKELDQIKERMSRCKPIDADHFMMPCRDLAGPSTSDACKTAKKKVLRKKCKFICGPEKARRNNFKKNVPKRMGWLWNLSPYAKQGWKPGAVRRPIRNIMSFFLTDFPPDTFRKSKKCHRFAMEPPEPPLLHVCKKNNVIYITLRPGDDCKAKPLQFIIEKTEEMIELTKLRDMLLAKGFAKCTCLKPITECFCRDDCEMSRLLCCIMREACDRGLRDVEDKLVLNDEYDSDAEFDFGITPPTYRDVKPKVCPKGTQFDPNDVVRTKNRMVRDMKFITDCKAGV